MKGTDGTKQTVGFRWTAIAAAALSWHCQGAKEGNPTPSHDAAAERGGTNEPTTGAGGTRAGSSGAGGAGLTGAGGGGEMGGSMGSGGGSGGMASGSGGMEAGSDGTVVVAGGGDAAADAASIRPIRVLIWNTALTYGHQSRMTAIPLLQAEAAANQFQFDTTYAHTQTLPEGTVDSTSDPSVFTDAGLDAYDVVFFLNTTGNTIDGDGMAAVHRQALTDFIEKKGRGFVGTHSATDTYDSGWPWYTDFIGANFMSHSNAGTPGTARWSSGVTHPILTAAAVPNPWNRSEEWYAFTRDPLASAIPGITILLTCTDTSNQFGERPSAWVHDMPGGGRMFYTAFGHSVDAFREPQVMSMIVAAIKWAAHRL